MLKVSKNIISIMSTIRQKSIMNTMSIMCQVGPGVEG